MLLNVLLGEDIHRYAITDGPLPFADDSARGKLNEVVVAVLPFCTLSNVAAADVLLDNETLLFALCF